MFRTASWNTRAALRGRLPAVLHARWKKWLARRWSPCHRQRTAAPMPDARLKVQLQVQYASSSCTWNIFITRITVRDCARPPLAARDQFDHQSLPKLLQVVYFLLHPNWRITYEKHSLKCQRIPVRFDYMQLLDLNFHRSTVDKVVDRSFEGYSMTVIEYYVLRFFLRYIHRKTRAIPIFVPRRKNNRTRTSHCSCPVLRDARPQHDRLSYLLFISMT